MNKGVMMRERRKYLHLTLKEVASAVGVAEATVQRWESGNIANIRTDKIANLASVLQLPIEEVMTWFDKETKWTEHDESANHEKICSEEEIAKYLEKIYGINNIRIFSKFLELNEHERNKITNLLSGYSKLDTFDRAEVLGYIKGIIDKLLSDPKYSIQKESSEGKAI